MSHVALVATFLLSLCLFNACSSGQGIKKEESVQRREHFRRY